MHFTKKTISEKRLDLVKKFKIKKILRFPGAYNPFCAKLIAEIGFDGVYVSGGVMSNDLGLPDIGLTTLDQVSYRVDKFQELQIFQLLLILIQVLEIVKKQLKYLKIKV